MTATNVTARVVDEQEYRRSHYAGHDEVGVEVEVMVRGTLDRDKALAEAKWRAEQDTDGQVERVNHVRTEGPISDPERGDYLLVTLDITYTREY